MGRTPMTVASANPLALSVLDRAEFVYRQGGPTAELERLMQGRGSMSATWNCRGWRMWYSCAAPWPMRNHWDRRNRGEARARRRRHRDRRTASGRHHAVGWRAVAPEGPQIGAGSIRSRFDHVCWQGEAVAAVVATSRAVAEDAAEIVSDEYQELDAVTDMRTALDPETPVIHPSFARDNLAFERNLDAGAVDQAFAESDDMVEANFIFGRHTGVTLEPRAVVADWNAAEARLTILPGHTGAAHDAEHRGAPSRA